METQEKPRLKHSEWMALQFGQWEAGTVAWMIEWYIREMSQIGSPVGKSKFYCMKRMQGEPIGKKVALALRTQDFIDHGKERKEASVLPSTAKKDFDNLGVMFKYAAAALTGQDGLSVVLVSLKSAILMLTKIGLVGKSAVRKRRPTLDEIDRLMAAYEIQDKHPRCVVKMAPLMAASIITTRRLGELCRIPVKDINWVKGTYWVRDLKHPTKKKGNDKEFTLLPEFADLLSRLPWLEWVTVDGKIVGAAGNPDQRIFPFHAQVASARHTAMKKELKIIGLRFHDNRREGISRWLKKLGPQKVRQYISGHDTTIILERNYDAPQAEDGLAEIALFGGLQPKPEVRAQ